MKKEPTLSIIIPYYNSGEYTQELLRVLDPQINDKVEVIVVDDGSREPFECPFAWCNVIRKNNGGVSSARNLGIEKSKGEYIAFIDSDDMVSKDYLSRVLEAAAAKPDLIELSWKSLTGEGYQFDYKLRSLSDRLTNPSVWCRVFRRSFLGNVRFNELKDSTEDEDFSRRVGYLDPERMSSVKRAIVSEYVYFYRNLVGSKIKRFKAGLMNTKRVVYYYQKIYRSMTWLLDEVKKQDERNEVWILTYQNEIPELARYAQISEPHSMWAHFAKGEKYDAINIIKPPIKTQVVIYRRFMHYIGGLMTFTLNFVDRLKDYYDITVITERMDPERLRELSRSVRVVVGVKEVVCDSLIMLSFLDPLPTNIHAGRVIRMVHACKTEPDWIIPKDYDELLFVSETAKKSHGDTEHEVIHNMLRIEDKQHLLLVSATRFPANDKGPIEKRMRQLADMLNEAGVSFTWLNFADGKMQDPPRNFINCGVSYNIQSIIKKADYLVQLSSSECWSYSCLESLMLGTALIVCPFSSIFEMGFKDTENGYIIPFDLKFDVKKLLKVPRFKYDYDNDSIVDQWRGVLGNTTPLHDYVPGVEVRVRILKEFRDAYSQELLTPGKTIIVNIERAEEMKRNLGEGYVQIIS